MSVLLLTFDPQLPELEADRRRRERTEPPESNTARLMKFGLLTLVAAAPGMVAAAGVAEVSAAGLFAVARSVSGAIGAATGVTATIVASVNVVTGRGTSDADLMAFSMMPKFENTSQVLDVGDQLDWLLNPKATGPGLLGSVRDRYAEDQLKPSRSVSPTVPGAVSLRYQPDAAGDEAARRQQMQENSVESSGAQFGLSVSSDGTEWSFSFTVGTTF